MGVGHLRKHFFRATFEQIRRQLRYLFDQCVDILLDGPSADKLMNQHVSPLADAVDAVGRSVLDDRVLPAVEVDHVGNGRQVEACAAGLE